MRVRADGNLKGCRQNEAGVGVARVWFSLTDDRVIRRTKC